jgi:hypothetical protein
MRPHVLLPTRNNLRFYRRLTAACLVTAGVALAIGLWALQSGDTAPGRRSPLSLIFGPLALTFMVVNLRARAAKLEVQVRQLASYGKRFVPRRVGTTLMQRDRIRHSHVVVAEWIDAQGEQREALSEPFDYDPYPLLERNRIEVLADPFHPRLSLVPDEDLPPRKWRQLDASQRERVHDHSPVSPFLLWFVWTLLIFMAVAVVAYPILFLINNRFKLFEWNVPF